MGNAVNSSSEYLSLMTSTTEYGPTVVGEVIHTDLCETMEKKSISGSNYFLLFEHDYWHYMPL